MAPVCQNTSKHNPGHEILFGRPVTPRDASPSPLARLEAPGRARGKRVEQLVLSPALGRSLLPSHRRNITPLRIWKAQILGPYALLFPSRRRGRELPNFQRETETPSNPPCVNSRDVARCQRNAAIRSSLAEFRYSFVDSARLLEICYSSCCDFGSWAREVHIQRLGRSLVYLSIVRFS